MGKVKLMCSYGGRIQSRPTGHQLYYAGGDTKILVVDRSIKFSEISAKLESLCNFKETADLSIKYQLPGEDLDSLVDDVGHMMFEYDRMRRISARLRLFVYSSSSPITPSNPDYLFGFDKDYQPSIGPHLDLIQDENYGLTPYGRVEGKIGISHMFGIGGG